MSTLVAKVLEFCLGIALLLVIIGAFWGITDPDSFHATFPALDPNAASVEEAQEGDYIGCYERFSPSLDYKPFFGTPPFEDDLPGECPGLITDTHDVEWSLRYCKTDPFAGTAPLSEEWAWCFE